MPRLSLLPAIALSLGLAAPFAPATAEPSPGAYLSARHAGILSDFDQAAQFYAMALANDPGNAVLRESLLISQISMGQITAARPVAQLILDQDGASLAANMALLADAAAQGDFDRVAELIGDGLGVGPLGDTLIEAWAAIGQGQMSRAIELFDDVASRPAQDRYGQLHKALALATVGDYEGAALIFAGQDGPRPVISARSVQAQVEVLSQLGQHGAALMLLERVFGADLPFSMQDLKTRLEAAEAIPPSVVTNPVEGLAEVFYDLATIVAQDADPSITLLYVRLSMHIDPDNADAVLLAAALLEDLNQPDLAIPVYDQIGHDDPAYLSAALGRIGALRQDGRIEAATEALRALTQDFPDQPAVFVAQGDFLRRDEAYEAAREAYDRAIALYGDPEPDQWRVYFARGVTEERTGMWPEAEADFRTALRLEPDQPQVLNYLGYSFVEMGENLDEAMDMIRSAVAARPDDGFITDSLGWGLYRLGRFDEAVGPMERAAELEPTDPIINDHLGDVYWSVGREREARFQWSRALSFEPTEKDAERIRRKLDIGLDAVLADEAASEAAK